MESTLRIIILMWILKASLKLGRYLVQKKVIYLVIFKSFQPGSNVYDLEMAIIVSKAAKILSSGCVDQKEYVMQHQRIVIDQGTLEYGMLSFHL